MHPASSEVECERGEKASSGRCWAEMEKESCIKEQKEGRSRRKKKREGEAETKGAQTLRPRTGAIGFYLQPSRRRLII